MPDLGLFAVGAGDLGEVEARGRVDGLHAERLLARFFRQLAENRGAEFFVIEDGVRGRERARPGITTQPPARRQTIERFVQPLLIARALGWTRLLVEQSGAEEITVELI